MLECRPAAGPIQQRLSYFQHALFSPSRTEHPTIGIGQGLGRAPASVAINGSQVHPKKTRELLKGDVFAIQCAGDAGYGPARERSRSAVADDVADVYVSPEAGEKDYGWRRRD